MEKFRYVDISTWFISSRRHLGKEIVSFNYHAFFMSMSFIVSEAIMMIQFRELSAFDNKRYKLYHIILHISALISAIIGIILALINHIARNMPTIISYIYTSARWIIYKKKKKILQ
jgi:hypothetical protein